MEKDYANQPFSFRDMVHFLPRIRFSRTADSFSPYRGAVAPAFQRKI